ncbi:MAG: hypothetical protein IJG07_10300 [Prevotella sp.]|nr:hypothetical protein [Prevotella sp.]
MESAGLVDTFTPVSAYYSGGVFSRRRYAVQPYLPKKVREVVVDIPFGVRTVCANLYGIKRGCTIRGVILVGAQAEAHEVLSALDSPALKASNLNGAVEVRRTPDVLFGVDTAVAVPRLTFFFLFWHFLG